MNKPIQKGGLGGSSPINRMNKNNKQKGGLGGSSPIILHAIVMKKPFFKTKQQALDKKNEMFPNEINKIFVRETDSSFRVRIKPKQQFLNTSFVSKIINPNITLIFGLEKK
jgi:hypothetical protein